MEKQFKNLSLLGSIIVCVCFFIPWTESGSGAKLIVMSSDMFFKLASRSIEWALLGAIVLLFLISPVLTNIINIFILSKNIRKKTPIVLTSIPIIIWILISIFYSIMEGKPVFPMPLGRDSILAIGYYGTMTGMILSFVFSICRYKKKSESEEVLSERKIVIGKSAYIIGGSLFALILIYNIPVVNSWFYHLIDKKPPVKELRLTLESKLPGYFKIIDFDILARQNIDNKYIPIFESVIKVVLEPKTDLYKKESENKNHGVIFVKQTHVAGNQFDIFARIFSGLNPDGEWEHTLNQMNDKNKNSSKDSKIFGIPLNEFDGARVIVKGSDEEKDFYMMLESKLSSKIRNNHGNYIDGDKFVHDGRGQYKQYNGRDKTFILHPKSKNEPAYIELECYIPKDGAQLVTEYASYPQNPQRKNDRTSSSTDFIARIKVIDDKNDHKVLNEEVVTSSQGWVMRQISLNDFADKIVRIRFENAAGGNNAWYFEFCAVSAFYIFK